MTRIRLAACLALLLAIPLPAGSQEPALRAAPASGAVLTGPAGNYTVTAPRPVRVIYGPSSITIDWTGGIDPVPPGPTPEPPTPEPPVPIAWGPLARVIVLYESSLMTGREPIYSAKVADALSKACPPDADGRPAWRVWDKDLDVTKEPTWVDAMAKARAALGADPGPVLYAFDAAARVKAVGLPPSLTPAEAISAIEGLKTGATP
jgi:hypothetical protein